MSAGLRNLGVRTLTGLLFVTVLLSCLLWSYLSFSLFFLVIAVGCLREYYRLFGSDLGHIPKIAGYMTAVTLYLLFINTDSMFRSDFGELYIAMVLMPIIVFGAALFDKSERPVRGAVYAVGGIVYCVLPFCMLHLFPNCTGDPASGWRPFTVLAMVLLIWSNDTFAYLTGKTLGRHRMVARISPGKTWEGTIGGLVLTFALSYVVRDYISDDHGDRWLLMGLLVPVIATMGDLFESLLKRNAGVKDSGSIMPGHGGFLDRFDSLLFVAPFLLAMFRLLELH